MNIEIENVDVKNSLFADFKLEFISKKLEFSNHKLDFSLIHKLQGDPKVLKVAFYNQLAEELNNN
jgi:hypothetical protein